MSNCQIPPQHIEFLEDRTKYGDIQSGTYKGLKWEARRPKAWPGEQIGLFHWNGYVETPRKLTHNEESKLDALSHGGITGGTEKMPGFDCTHYRDYQPRWYTMHQSIDQYYPHPDINEVYRDFPYVLSVIERMIDYLSSLPINVNYDAEAEVDDEIEVDADSFDGCR